LAATVLLITCASWQCGVAASFNRKHNSAARNASRGYDASGIGSEVWFGEGMLGVAAERRTIVRTTSMTRDVVFSRAVRSSIEQSGKGQLEQEIPLPGMAHLESQVVAPLVAHGELLGILCIQSDEAGRFLVDDERVTQIVGRHLAA